jgi:hypothetical protein
MKKEIGKYSEVAASRRRKNRKKTSKNKKKYFYLSFPIFLYFSFGALAQQNI